MKKFLGYSLLAAACVLLSGCATAHADEGDPGGWRPSEDIVVKSGYYICEENDSYFHVDGNMIELCDFDYRANAEKHWNELMEECDDEERERQAPNHDLFIENTVNWATEKDPLQEFVVCTFPLSKYDPEKSDLTAIMLNYEFAKERGAYSGYNYYEEDSSIVFDRYVFSYVGEELPEKAE